MPREGHGRTVEEINHAVVATEDLVVLSIQETGNVRCTQV